MSVGIPGSNSRDKDRASVRLTALALDPKPPEASDEVMIAVADVLLAAAHADGGECGAETQTIRRILAELSRAERLPDELERHIDEFDPETFDMRAAAARLHALPLVSRRRVVELVRRVCDANDAFDLEEERYIIALGLALSLAPEDLADLVVHAADGLDGKLKRVFDVAFAGTFLATAWPLLLAIAIGVKVTSPGPAIFKQRRYGRDGREIEVWKFRTMRVTENGAQVKQATRGDSRITRLGAFLRRTSMDELPQFINVLKGDMSVVGPRPHAVAHNEHYRTQILEYMLRHKVRPGITGWAQVNGWRGETDTLEKMIGRVEHDLEYIRRWSLAFDVQIVLKTIFGRSVHQNAY